MERYHNTAIVFGNLKEALLHFEYVIPMNFTGQVTGLQPQAGGQGAVEQFKDSGMEDYHEMFEVFQEPASETRLYPPQLAANPRFHPAVNIFDGFLQNYMIRAIHGEDAFRRYIEQLSEVINAPQPVDPRILLPTLAGLERHFELMVKAFHLQDIPVDCSMFEPKDESATTSNLFSAQIFAVDVEKVNIRQIMEFREDKDTMRKMRNFRLFAYQQYKEKERAFIEDDIEKKYSDYHDAIKASGFETTVKTLSFLMDSKLLAGTVATSVASLLMGNAQLAIAAFGAGAVLEIGKLSLEYAKQRHSLTKICGDNPISYIADARKRLGKVDRDFPPDTNANKA